ncbi:hypothetical protein H4R34_001071 [Dimargaris verticillata]|uniref:Mitochondrial carrier domain-containing protein n=1 Tax=Dimargaris verticillata TaxID=2761393 RepID=A0A9W8B5H1_9FUNG|nr:hypothetical protein H4R34_001071 [Dimargaris verticillata]
MLANQTIFAASSAAVCGVLAGFPFDTVKTRMQTHHYQSLLHCVRLTYREEGVRGFFRGMIPPLITISIVKSISFSVYENTKCQLKSSRWPPFQSSELLPFGTLCFASGATAGAVVALLSCPFELVKVQQQLEKLLAKVQPQQYATGTISRLPLAASTSPLTIHAIHSQQNGAGPRPPAVHVSPLESLIPNQSNPPRKPAPPLSSSAAQRTTTSSWAVARRLYVLHGAHGLYQGLTCHVARDALGTGIYFSTYELTKRLLSPLSGGQPPGPLTHFLAGGTCGVFSWLLIFPLDLVKSVIQKEALLPMNQRRYNGFWHCLSSMYRHHGLAAFYRGISVTLLRAFPLHSLNFLVYEWVLDVIRRRAQ